MCLSEQKYYIPSSDVYLVKEVSSGRSYAVKTIPLHPEVGLLHLNEIDILTRLHHPNLLRARDILKMSQDDISLILPLGKWTLESAINQQLLSSKEVELMWKLSCGLTFLHEQGILHLNLRPDHIILRGNQEKLRPFIADFSYAHHGKYLILDQLYTSLNYCPPELLLAEIENQNLENKPKSYIYSTKTDIWSLGVIFLEILTGKRAEIFYRGLISQSPETRLIFLQNQLPIQYQDAVDLLFRMLDPDPETRLDSSDLLTSGFFITRVNQPIPRGHVEVKDTGDIPYLDPNLLDEIEDLLDEYIPDFSQAAWQGAFNLYTKIGVDDISIFWVALFISYKLYDYPKDVYLEFFVSNSQLSRDTFLDLEIEVVLEQRGCLASLLQR